jgi:hypothetical protein
MHKMTSLISESWSPKTIEKMRSRGCGLINCRSRFEERNSAGEEIQRIIDRGSDAKKSE